MSRDGSSAENLFGQSRQTIEPFPHFRGPDGQPLDACFTEEPVLTELEKRISQKVLDCRIDSLC